MHVRCGSGSATVRRCKSMSSAFSGYIRISACAAICKPGIVAFPFLPSEVLKGGDGRWGKRKGGGSKAILEIEWRLKRRRLTRGFPAIVRYVLFHHVAVSVLVLKLLLCSSSRASVFHR